MSQAKEFSERCYQLWRSEGEYKIRNVKVTETDDKGKKKERNEPVPYFYGIQWRHPHITMDKSNSTCCDQWRKNRHCAEWVVCLNQAMQVYTDREMLLSGIPTTIDGLHILRFTHPVLFEALFS